MSEVIDKINNQIDVDREILSVLPKNNKKNLKAYKDKVLEIEQEYSSYLNNVLSEIKRRALKINSIAINPQIEEIAKEIDSMKDIELLDDRATPFEKMKLDETLFVLKRFYKNNLELVNSSIMECLEKFKKAGVILTEEDFHYSIYTKEYMEVFLDEMKKGEPNSQRVKDCFEQIYWKCPDIIMHIEINFRSLYLRNEKAISNYYENEQKKILKVYNLTKEEIVEKYNSLEKKLIELKNKDSYLILKKFLDGEDSTKNYEEANIQKLYKKLINVLPDEIEKDRLQEYNQNIEKLSNSLYEYRNYLKFKFIYDEIIEIYNNPEKNGKIYDEKKKQIAKLEGKLLKENRKIEKFEKHKGIIAKIFSRNQNKLEKINIDINSKVPELKNIYRELEEAKVKNIIKSELKDSSTIYDAFLLIRNFYSFLVDKIIKQYEDMEQEEIAKLIKEFKDFTNYPNITIINNLKISDEKDIALVIKDKYSLCNINITRGDFEEENIQSMITTVKNICDNTYLENSIVNIDDVKYLMEANKIFEQNNKEKSNQETKENND